MWKLFRLATIFTRDTLSFCVSWISWPWSYFMYILYDIEIVRFINSIWLDSFIIASSFLTVVRFVLYKETQVFESINQIILCFLVDFITKIKNMFWSWCGPSDLSYRWNDNYIHEMFTLCFVFVSYQKFCLPVLVESFQVN